VVPHASGWVHLCKFHPHTATIYVFHELHPIAQATANSLYISEHKHTWAWLPGKMEARKGEAVPQQDGPAAKHNFKLYFNPRPQSFSLRFAPFQMSPASLLYTTCTCCSCLMLPCRYNRRPSPPHAQKAMLSIPWGQAAVKPDKRDNSPKVALLQPEGS
jgi:hypothetical protein